MKKKITQAARETGLKVKSSWGHEVQGTEPAGRVSLSNISVDEDGSWKYSNIKEMQAWLTVTGPPGGGYSDNAARMIRPSTKERAFMIVPACREMNAQEFYRAAHELAAKVQILD